MRGVRATIVCFARTFFMATDSEKNTKHAKREQLRSKAFWIAFEMVFVFGIPAAVAVLLSQWLIGNEIVGDWALYAGLFLAFTISWVIVLFRVKSLSAEFKQVDKDGSKDKKA